MTTTVDTEARGFSALVTRYYELHPSFLLIVRWTAIAALTGIVFRESFFSIGETAHLEGIGGYVWTVPTVAILVAVGITRRHRTELPIHDRQTDIIVGTMGLVLALLIQLVLLQRYALYFHLLRLDLLAMWLFVLSTSIVLFGLRPVARFAWVWAMMFMVFALPYYLMVIFLGGTKFAAGAANLLIAGVGAGIATGRTARRGLMGSIAAWIVGFAVLGTIAVFFTDAPILVYQEVPPVTAVIVVGFTMFLRSRRGMPKRVLDRKVEPLAVMQIWSVVPLVLAISVPLAFVHLPTEVSTAPIVRTAPAQLSAGQPLVAPPGWTTVQRRNYRDMNRLYGDNAVLVRQWMTSLNADTRFDKLARPRTVVVDSLVSERPFSFGVYPDRVLYGLTAARISDPRPVDLGMGVTARLISVVDDDLLVTWNSVQFVWGDGQIAQRVTIFAVDNHDPGAPFPDPSADITSSVRTLITLLFRGNAVLDQRIPSFKDAQLLTEFGRVLVAAQFRSAGKTG
ncbi:hypothetical protein [Mycobacterium sp.]|uniref:hypothetical protein n=1 Tax=Mycobacterium sp. TaxID=1785 RepID=UPI002C313E94|nr:hypothetical protein [Mycobacterium sp.]HKP43514.1 hypothetical protein [Mycobacterium sp.]